MKKKKPALKKAPKKQSAPTSLVALQKRVTALEQDFKVIRSEMTSIAEAMASMKNTWKLIEERTQRGEVLLMAMQGEHRRAFKVMSKIAAHLNVDVETTITNGAKPALEEPEITRDIEEISDEEIEEPVEGG